MRSIDFVGRILVLLSLAVALTVLTFQGSFASFGTTERVSVDSSGNQGNGPSEFAQISGDGRYVAFQSDASNLVAGDTYEAADVFVHDRQTGATERVSVDSSGKEGNSHSVDPAISADGRYVVFDSVASNLVPNDTNGYSDIFVRDRQTGATEQVSVDSSGNEGNSGASEPEISADGRYVAFHSDSSNLVAGDTNSVADAFVHDRLTGATERVSVDSSGNQGNGGSYYPAVSADGRYVAFDSHASNLVVGDTNGAVDVFVHDRHTGATERVSVDGSGNQGDGHSYYSAMSADGRYVAFESHASNLVVGDTNGAVDVFVYDRLTGATERVSVDSSGNQGNDYSLHPEISGDGRYVAFESHAANLVAGDTNSVVDAFVHDRQTGATERVSVDSSGNEGNSVSVYPAITAEGRYVAFMSAASNLVTGDTNGEWDVFVRDRLAEEATPTSTPTPTRTFAPTPTSTLPPPVGGIVVLPNITSSDGPGLGTATYPVLGAVAVLVITVVAGTAAAKRRGPRQ